MANKFKIKLKVTGFELEIEGSREDVPLMAQAVGQQMSGLLTPASNIVEGEIFEDSSSTSDPVFLEKPKKRPRKRNQSARSAPSSSNRKNQSTALDWKHDPLKWGTPQQDWSTLEKSLWLLYVASKEIEIKEMPGNIISGTFNKHFRQSKPIYTGQINRDLGRAKGANGKIALVVEDTSHNPSSWYLTQEGEKRAQELVSMAHGKQ